MRKLTKFEKPIVLLENDVDWTQELLAATPGTAEYRSIELRYGHREIKAQLRAETFQKCIYCESAIDAISFPHIEHIWPKSLYRALTFAWENLTIACQVCNVNKGTHDPSNLNFVHPYADDPSERFIFFGALIAPSSSDVAASNMINLIDLNRKELVISRTEVVSRVIAIYLEAIVLPVGARREFLSLAIAILTRAQDRYSRVAECTAAACEFMYADLLAV